MIIPTVAAALVGAPLAAAALHRRAVRRRAAAALAVDSPRAIVEDGFVEIGGIEQWIGIRGEDRDNPILLFLHGGPGTPYSIFAPRLRAWERHFTLVHWDQRGAGKTFGKNRRRGHGALTAAQLTADGLAVVEHVCARLGQERLVLVASSAGNLIGLPMAQARPERFSALVTTDLNVDTRAGERLGWELARARLRAAGDVGGVAALEQIGPEPRYWDRHAWRRKQSWLMKVDPTAAAMVRRLILPSLYCSPLHTLGDVRDYLLGLAHVEAARFDELMAWDARQQGLGFAMPFFWLHGERDVLTPPALAADYFADVVAPYKDATLIAGAGHLAAFAQPDQFLIELLVRVRPALHRRCPRPCAPTRAGARS
jgi:pimeloyl-ACP methyl ester carboxylesterase